MSRDKIKEMTRRIDKIQDNGVKHEVNFGNLYVRNEELAEYLIKYYQPKERSCKNE